MEKKIIFPPKCCFCLSDCNDTIEMKISYEKKGYREIIKTTYKLLVPICQKCKGPIIKSRRTPYIVWIICTVIFALFGLIGSPNEMQNGFFSGAIVGTLIGMFIFLGIGLSTRNKKEPAGFVRGTGDLIFKNAEYQRLFDELNWPIFKNQNLEKFCKSTYNAWISGRFPEYKKYYIGMYSYLSLQLMFKNQIKTEDNAIRIFFEKYTPLDGEFYVCSSADKKDFILTNLRLLQWDGNKQKHIEIAIADIDTSRNDISNSTLTINKISGETVLIEKIQSCPSEEILSLLISRSKNSNL